MATKRTKTTKATRRGRRSAIRVRPAVRRAAERVRGTWSETMASLAAAEKAVEKQVRRVLQRNRIGTKDAATVLKDVKALVARERKKAARHLEVRLTALQARARKERHAVARMANTAAQSALAAFNVPSRREVQDLTRKVDQLSRKIDARRR